jgi:hypothetical protein
MSQAAARVDRGECLVAFAIARIELQRHVGSDRTPTTALRSGRMAV